MFCKRCGAEIPEGKKFCADCGKAVNSAEKNTKIALIVVSCVALVAIVCALVFGFKLMNKNNDELTTTTVAITELITTITTTEVPTTAEPTTVATTVSTTKKQPTTTKKPKVSGPTIPDPGAYFRLSRSDDGIYGPDDARYRHISYKTDLTYPQALQEYISVISDSKYQFKLIHTYESSSIFSYKDYCYYFNYTGGKDIPDIVADTKSDVDCDLKISITYFPADEAGERDEAYLSLNYHPDAPFKLVDPGCRTSFTLRDLGYVS